MVVKLVIVSLILFIFKIIFFLIVGITHTEITEVGFIRSLARFFYDTRIKSNGIINEQEYFNFEYTVDDLYKVAYPTYSEKQLLLYSLPFKFILDSIMIQNVLVDFNPNTKKLSSAHFDSEAFINSSRRILQLRQISNLFTYFILLIIIIFILFLVINDVRNTGEDLTNARQLLGQLLHTLQDFYSHSNWIEMGKTDINVLIGINENIGSVAGPNQATCTHDGCTKKTRKMCK